MRIGIFFSGAAFVVLGVVSSATRIDTAAQRVIDTPREALWALATDFEGAFESPNPDHHGTEVLTTPKHPSYSGLGFQQRVRVRVGSVLSVLESKVCELVQGRRFRWCARTQYQWHGVTLIKLFAGGTFRIDRTHNASGYCVSHRIWARFLGSLYRRTVGWPAVSRFAMGREAREHSRLELDHFARALRSRRK